MNKGRKIIYSFAITSAVWLAVIAALVIIAICFKVKIDEYYKTPLCEGLCPSIGLGLTFPEKDMDLMIERYSIYRMEEYGTPQFYDRVKDLILEHYTLVGDTYYYNPYLQSGIYAYENINLLPFILVSAGLFMISTLAFALCIKRCSKDKIRMTKPYAFIMIILSYLSCDVYAVYRFMKGYREIE